MKKLLVLVCLSLFVFSAHAIEVEIFGAYDISGNYIMNNNLAKGDDAENTSYYELDFVIWARLIIDPKTAITIRSFPFYQYTLGTPGGEDAGLVVLDRAYVTHMLTDNLTFDLGRMTGNNYNAFGSGWYYAGTNRAFEESGGRWQIRATYGISEDIKVFAVAEKMREYAGGTYLFTDADGDPLPGLVDGDEPANSTGQDWDNYIIGAKMTFGDLQVNPTFVFANHPVAKFHSYSGLIALDYMPESGLNFSGAASYISGTKHDFVATEDIDFSLFGVYADVSFVKDNFTIGAMGAYAGYEKDSGEYFGFGGDFLKTLIMDSHLNSEYGTPAMTMVQLYGEIKPNETCSLFLSASYFMSNVDGDGNRVSFIEGVTIGKDTTAIEINAIASYALTDSTTFSLGAGYLMMNDILDAAGDKFSPDAVTMLFWGLTTEF